VSRIDLGETAAALTRGQESTAAGAAPMRRAQRSPIIMAGAFVLPPVMLGMTEAPATFPQRAYRGESMSWDGQAVGQCCV